MDESRHRGGRDDLYAAAKELALGGDKGRRMARLMESSMLRLREPLAHALPRSADMAQSTLPAVGGTQIRQARELLGWPAELPCSSREITTAAIDRAETGGESAVTGADWHAILAVLERAGIEFTAGATAGLGYVRGKVSAVISCSDMRIASSVNGGAKWRALHQPLPELRDEEAQ